jgi:hypothetical protein
MKNRFTKALFWDTNEAELCHDKHRVYIIRKVLNYGTLEDWHALKKLYGKEAIFEESVKMSDLHPKTVSFLAVYFDYPITGFRSYHQSTFRL